MYAIIEDSGTQIKVSEGDVIDVDLRERDDEVPGHRVNQPGLLPQILAQIVATLFARGSGQVRREGAGHEAMLHPDVPALECQRQLQPEETEA